MKDVILSFPRTVRAGVSLVVLLLVLLLLARLVDGCAGSPAPGSSPPPTSTPPSPGAQAGPEGATDAGSLLLGAYDASDAVVVDGDTLRFPDGLRVRVLGIDTEEVFRSAAKRRLAERDFDAYARQEQGDSTSPRKYGTPAGEAASDAAARLVARARRLRLERDSPTGGTLDPFGRMLAHVFLEGPDGEVHLAEALVRAGHSPNFVKYGRSVRFDARIAAAERQARDTEVGIWSRDGPGHYPDYPARLEWWHARADQLDAWRAAPPSPERVTLEDEDAETRLASLVGGRAVVFGLLRNTKTRGTPQIFWLRHRPKNDFAVVVFDPLVWDALDHDALRRGYVTVEGPVTEYRDRPQIVVTDPSQVSTR